MKTTFRAAFVCLFLTASSVVWCSDDMPPARPLEIGGVLSGVDASTSTLKINGNSLLVTTQTVILLNTDGIDQRVSNLKDIPVNKADVYYELDAKGHLGIIRIVLPSSTGKKP